MVTASAPTAFEGSSLSLRGVGKVFLQTDGSPVEVLRDLSLTVAQGELIGLIGPSGCGKSTLLRLIAGLDRPTAGELQVDSEPILGPSAERGLMFQDPNLFPWLSIRGNIQAGLVARGVLRQQRHQVEEFLALVGLQAFADAYPYQLSGGMAQRAALARALVNQPRVLLLDEPLGALDQFIRMSMQDVVLGLWQARGTTMLLVTHDIDEALYMCDRIVVLSGVPLGRPRLRTDPRFLELRAEILGMLNLAGGGKVSEANALSPGSGAGTTMISRLSH
jgi:ABC-type nitrate/sulfonate/bicarbonate transport system ATPase subunit